MVKKDALTKKDTDESIVDKMSREFNSRDGVMRTERNIVKKVSKWDTVAMEEDQVLQYQVYTDAITVLWEFRMWQSGVRIECNYFL